jgi:hypothetical protein
MVIFIKYHSRSESYLIHKLFHDVAVEWLIATDQVHNHLLISIYARY